MFLEFLKVLGFSKKTEFLLKWTFAFIAVFNKTTILRIENGQKLPQTISQLSLECVYGRTCCAMRMSATSTDSTCMQHVVSAVLVFRILRL